MQPGPELPAWLGFEMGDKERFLEKCGELAEYALSWDSPTVINHFDCDGITSGSIAVEALRRAGKKPKVLTLKKIDDDYINVNLVGKNELLFVDFGGTCKSIDQIKDAAIIDHHQTEGTKTLQANPQLHGFDGGREISSAGVAHLVFGVREDLAIVGAVGDVQAPLVSLNREILHEAEKKGTVEARLDLKAYGKNTRSLAVFLTYSDEPYLPGITGNEEASVALLEQAGLKNKPFETTYNDLPENEKSALRAAIVEYLSRSGFAGVSADLFGECYILKNQPEKSELRDASEFSTLLNACGRNGRFEVGMGVCLGEPGALDTAKEILAQHKKNLQLGIQYASKHTTDMGEFYLIDGRGQISDTIIGVVAGMIGTYRRDKPILALSIDEEGKIKVSGRAKEHMIKEGINLGMALKASAGAIGGVGGGHRQAAGASLPIGKTEEFLVLFGEKLCEQKTAQAP